ncbi:MAG: HK97 family phage prohead protease [Oscillospiraceae bacterium]
MADTRVARQMRCLTEKFTTREDAGDLYIEGYFAVFNSIYEIWPGATETIKPGAFTESISGDVRALTNHDTTLVLGRNKAGTLTLREDSRGLWGSIKINRDDADAMNLYSRVRRGDVDQCSFGFDIEKETFIDNGDGSYRWEIETVNPLYEVSVCTFPAYQETNVEARHADLDNIKKRDAEAWRARMKSKLGGIKNVT